MCKEDVYFIVPFHPIQLYQYHHTCTYLLILLSMKFKSLIVLWTISPRLWAFKNWEKIRLKRIHYIALTIQSVQAMICSLRWEGYAQKKWKNRISLYYTCKMNPVHKECTRFEQLYSESSLAGMHRTSCDFYWNKYSYSKHSLKRIS